MGPESPDDGHGLDGEARVPARENKARLEAKINHIRQGGEAGLPPPLLPGSRVQGHENC